MNDKRATVDWLVLIVAGCSGAPAITLTRFRLQGNAPSSPKTKKKVDRPFQDA